MKTNYSINEICERNNFVIVDASAIIQLLGPKQVTNNDVAKKMEQSQRQNEILSFWEENLTPKIFITRMVENELTQTYNGGYTKSIKRNSGKKGGDLLYLRRERKKEQGTRSRLITKLENDAQILDLKREQPIWYKNMYNKHNKLITNVCSETDLDILISGLMLVKNGNNVGIISNDIKTLLYGWKSLIKEENISPERYNFYIHQNLGQFKSAISH